MGPKPNSPATTTTSGSGLISTDCLIANGGEVDQNDYPTHTTSYLHIHSRSVYQSLVSILM